MTTIHSVRYKDSNNKEKYYELSIRDTCGASSCYTRSMQLCQLADAIIICFNIHQASTFEKAKQWIHDLTSNKDRYPMLLLIGTTLYEHKVSLSHSKDIEATELCQKKNIYYQTLCLSSLYF